MSSKRGKIKFSIPSREESDTPSPADVIPFRGNDEEPPSDDTPQESLGKRAHRESGQQTRTIRSTTRIRLGMLCAMLVMVLVAMNHASKPETWNWLFKFDNVDLQNGVAESNGGPAPVTSPIESSEEATNRFVDSTDDDEAANTETGSPTTEPENSGNNPAGPPSDPINQVAVADVMKRESRFWQTTLEELDGPQQLRLFNLVDSAVRQEELKSSSTAALRPVIKKLKLSRQKFSQQLEGESQAAFLALWSESVLPAFDAILNDQPNRDLIDQNVRDLSPTLRHAADRLIEDKTPVNRVREAYAWFAAWADVYEQPIEQDVTQTATVTQLLSQPDVWRGEVINVSGTALRVERVEASHNALGIDRYFVIWIKPDHPSSFPYCVYTLGAPESLMGEPGERMREVNQRVQATARFFKNRLFNSGEQGQAAVAPVLMTSSVTLPVKPPSPAKQKFRMPGGNTIAMTLGLIGGLACLIAFSVYRNTLSTQVRALPRSERMEEPFRELKQDKRVETTLEKLQRLSQQHKLPDDPDDADPDVDQAPTEDEADRTESNGQDSEDHDSGDKDGGEI